MSNTVCCVRANQIIAVRLSLEANPNVICSQERENAFLWRTARKSSRPFWQYWILYAAGNCTHIHHTLSPQFFSRDKTLLIWIYDFHFLLIISNISVKGKNQSGTFLHTCILQHLTKAWFPGDFDSQRTYCAKYDRLAGGDEVFCDQLHYATVQEEEEDEVLKLFSFFLLLLFWKIMQNQNSTWKLT